MSLKNAILTAWTNAKNEAERGKVLAEIEAARHEIRIEYLWAEPELRNAIATLEEKLETIVRGTYEIAPCNVYTPDPGRTAPLVGIAGYIAMLLAVRAEHKQCMHVELLGKWVVHKNRIRDAIEARRVPAKPGDGYTGYVDPVDPLTVECMICKAPIGTECKP